MGFDRITEAVDALNAAGLRAQRGYPAGVMPCLTGPVAAVNVKTVSPEETKLAVQVFSAVDGPACEDAARLASETLTGIGAICTAEGCRWDNRAGVFSCLVVALWRERTDCRIVADGKTLSYAVAVSAKKHISSVQVTDAATGETVEERRDLGWSITVEELLPSDYMPETDTKEPFTVYIHRPGGSERYEKCQWVQSLLEDVPGGLRRVRMARTWEIRGIIST